ncbi:hypothetical protein HYALB_00001083 [Hymenoscyphus albidus]|uniref:Sulfate transporter family protein n=1 Tax=Hymenoscyphus albidus TaxID=595503 RepID=A0A9N9QCS0_9HELO|nr:hypothetical protein HYALB_00001083 [Hymenoscyphus albidus]
MSLPAHNPGSFRRGRASSTSSHSNPRIIPGASTNNASASASASHAHHGSFRSFDTHLSAVFNPLSASGPREPTRSSLHMLSYRAPIAPIDTAQYAHSVREDTAELASYALSDRGSIRSASPPPSRRSIQTNLDTYLDSIPKHNSSTNLENLSHQETIPEVSEPPSSENGGSPSNRSSSSTLTEMLRRSPPSTSPTNNESQSKGSPSKKGKSTNGGTVEPDQRRLILTSDGVVDDERTPLLPRKPKQIKPKPHPDYIGGEDDLEQQVVRRVPSWPKLRNVVLWPRARGMDIARTIANPKSWDREAIWKNAVLAPTACLPAVVLGILLTILDALSYGMILFPLGQPLFEKLGSAGISMFYVSCIVSQLIFSCGGSGFKGGIGSEMIEVVPFFHKMAITIMTRVGEENPQAVIATTITSYAISSIITGLVFFSMGYFRFGYLVGFIPRHILTGCIGGVGWFLIATGIEVSARMEGEFVYSFATLHKMFQSDTVALWVIPLALAVILFRLQHIWKSRYLLPAYILCIPAIFYFFTFSLDQLDMDNLTRDDFKLVHWGAIGETIPAMMALTFFGLLHVPINVPSLAFTINDDNINLDNELIAHGLSNAISGGLGSIQNYLVYANSVLFYRSGGDSRLAGIMLAIGTMGVLVIGPKIIGFIPVMMVGTLIYILGFELFVEAMWDTRKKLGALEYFTVSVIVLVMGTYDFVVGIFVGVALAMLSLTIQTSNIPAIRASYSGEIAGSTVRRNPTQTCYLRKTGQQVHVTKLAGYLFFGTIGSVEDRIRALIEEDAFKKRPIRFLVLDLYHVTGIDYSAAEAFNRLNRIFSMKGVTLLMSGVVTGGPLAITLANIGLGSEGNEVKFFEDLNSALESCENELLKTLYSSKAARSTRNPPANVEVPGQVPPAEHSIDVQFSSPRRNQLQVAATMTLDDSPGENRYANFKEPLRLILQTFQGLTDKNEDFWFRVIPFFTKKEYIAGTVLYHSGEVANGFYLLQEGILRADYDLPQGKYFESIVAGTTCGELPFFSDTDRTATVQAERDCVCWVMDRENWEKLQKADQEVVQELLRIGLKLTSERMSAITSYVLTTAG